MSNGFRRKTRHIFKCNSVDRQSRMMRALAKFELGQKVILKIDSGVHSGMYHRRHYGQIGIVDLVGVSGNAYRVKTSKGASLYTISSHLRRFQ